MTSFEDVFTKLLDRAVDALTAVHPARFGAGVVLGSSLCFIARMVSHTLPDRSAYSYISESPLWGWIVVGLLVTFFQPLRNMVTKRTTGNEEVDAVLRLIERGNFSEAERRQAVQEPDTAAAENIALRKELKGEISAIELKIQAKEVDKHTGA